MGGGSWRFVGEFEVGVVVVFEVWECDIVGGGRSRSVDVRSFGAALSRACVERSAVRKKARLPRSLLRCLFYSVFTVPDSYPRVRVVVLGSCKRSSLLDFPAVSISPAALVRGCKCAIPAARVKTKGKEMKEEDPEVRKHYRPMGDVETLTF